MKIKFEYKLSKKHISQYIKFYVKEKLFNTKSSIRFELGNLDNQNLHDIWDQLIMQGERPMCSTSLNKEINYTNKFENINFSSSKFLKGNPNCISVIRVRVLGSLNYDELMYELKKRAATMGGNAIGIYDLAENKEIIYANKEIDVKNSLKVRYEFMKQTNLISKVTADVFRCKSDR